MLTPSEREVIITRADDENVWHIHTDSTRAFGKRLLTIAKSLGVKVTPQGVGFTFDLPAKAISVRKPRQATQEERDRLARARPKKSVSLQEPTEAKTT